MDALYFINIKSKEVLISKEFNQRDNNIKIHIFLAELENLLKEEISPIINISNTIFLYKILNSNEHKNQSDESNIMLVALLSEDVFNKIINKKDFNKFSL